MLRKLLWTPLKITSRQYEGRNPFLQARFFIEMNPRWRAASHTLSGNRNENFEFLEVPLWFKCFLSFLLFMLAPQTYALQIKPIADNQTVSAKISAQELTRIFVTGDRIQTVRGLEGAYFLNKDVQQGVVFIKPMPNYQQQAFNLFVTTEQGRNFTLRLTPANLPAENIELKPLHAANLWASRWEKSAPYSQQLIALIKAMVKQKPPQGYAVVYSTRSKSIKISSQINMELLAVYYGDQLRGEVWRIKNISKKSIFLDAQQFYQNNDLAMAVVKEVLPARDETFFYRVIRYVKNG